MNKTNLHFIAMTSIMPYRCVKTMEQPVINILQLPGLNILVMYILSIGNPKSSKIMSHTHKTWAFFKRLSHVLYSDFWFLFKPDTLPLCIWLLHRNPTLIDLQSDTGPNLRSSDYKTPLKSNHKIVFKVLSLKVWIFQLLTNPVPVIPDPYLPLPQDHINYAPS